VQRAETLALIAARYNVSTAELAALNGLTPNAKMRPGRSLLVPSTQPAASTLVAQNETVATTRAPAASAAPPAVAAAPTVAPPAAAHAPMAARAPAVVSSPPTAVPQVATASKAAAAPAPAPVAVAAAKVPAAVPSATPLNKPTGAVPVEVAQLESQEDAEQIAKVGRPAARAEPVSAAQAEALGPALGPGIEVSVSPDPTDYAVAKDDTIKVATIETLGHYADWLDTSAARLRVINHLAFKKQVMIGHKIKLEFVKVSREDFEHKRREYHREQQASYFASHRILGTEVYLARRGDSGWTVTKKNSELPLWLLQQYNPDLDLSEMHPGTQIVVPRIEEVSAAGG
jgi:LysM repeat protein